MSAGSGFFSLTEAEPHFRPPWSPDYKGRCSVLWSGEAEYKYTH